MKITKDTEAKFTFEGKVYRVIDITWAKDKSIDTAPTIIYEDENGENQHINSGKGELTI